MFGRVELRLGDMFEGPNDLVIIPCSTRATVTWFVEERLEQFNISKPAQHMAPGDVIFQKLTGAENIAPEAGFAASVRRNTSDPNWLKSIARRIGEFAGERPGIGRIACPLLGTGAGGLDPGIAFTALVEGFLESAPSGVTLCLYVQKPTVYAALSKLAHGVGTHSPDAEWGVSSESPVRVLVSYSRSAAEHNDWVKELATMLRKNGIDARLDLWHLRPGMDLPQWMSNELEQADRVVVVCDELYSQKSDRRHGGVGWEVKMIQGDLYTSQHENPDKYIPVVVTDQLSAGLPAFLRATYCLHWPRTVRAHRVSQLEEELLRTLYRAREEAPPLGQPPSFAVTRPRR